MSMEIRLPSTLDMGSLDNNDPGKEVLVEKRGSSNTITHN